MLDAAAEPDRGRARDNHMLKAMETPLPAAVVFDNDGLLLDTESVWTRAEQDLFERRGLEFTPRHKRELVGTSAEIAGGILEQRLGETGRAAELIEELNELVVAELEHGVEAMLGAAEVLHQLKRRGTPIGLVSNSPLAFVQRSLEIVGFVDHFDVVLSAHEVAAPKPAPDPYLEACRRLVWSPAQMWLRWRTHPLAWPLPARPASP